MRYCNNCRHITTGEPLFCNFCGCSYGVKLCPQRHVNPRTAQTCSQCGSADFSSPGPPQPLTLSALLWLLRFLPGILLVLVSVLFLIGFVQALVSNQAIVFQFMQVGLVLALLWWLFLQLPLFLRRWLSKFFGKSGSKSSSHHGH